MNRLHIEGNLAALRAALSSCDGYIEAADDTYGRLFRINFVPCCIPLPTIAWLNPISEGIFVRIIFPASGKPAKPLELLMSVNAINYGLPIGTFVADIATGEVRFKSAIFIGDKIIDAELLSNLLASAEDMVRTHYKTVIQAVTGFEHAH